ncbi:site-specific DNA-methyltransferase [Flavihumibacter sp. R14]|nr:site-specific DNA-methyltransferase [Flavihumibacter soli]
MAKRINKATKTTSQKPIEQYEHKDKQRVNNPPVGLVDAHTDNGGYKKKTYQYDPHLDPQLQWAGKAEHTSFDVPTVSLHVHERIDPRRIIETVKKEEEAPTQMSLFEEQKKPLREAIEFYKHKENWSNRLIAGDSLLVMNSLLEKEGMGGKVQMVFFDPPYGISYKSNFQAFVNKRDVKEKDEDLTSEPEMLKAFRDTWELGIHSYLTYIRDRMLLAKELLDESGSVFIQISDENVHLIRSILDEVFDRKNEVATIVWKKGTPVSKTIRNSFNYLLWYAKDKEKVKSRKIFFERTGIEGTTEDPKKLALWGEFQNGEVRTLTTDEKRNILLTREKANVFRVDKIIERGDDEEKQFEFEFEGQKYTPDKGYQWRGDKIQMQRLLEANRILKTKDGFGFKFYITDYPIVELTNFWDDTAGNISDMIYVVQTNEKIIQRCLMMTTDPGDLTLDITCGSGTTAYVSEQFGRRWITCDTSRVALTLAKQRLMTANFDYYELAYPNEGIGSGFKYNKVPHITLKSIANNENPPEETLVDKPIPDNKRQRVTGPFTLEAVPAPVAKSFEEVEADTNIEADISISRSGETLRQDEWRNELLRSGVRAKGGKLIEFTRVEPLSGTRFLQAEAETKEDNPKRVVVCFGPEHAPLEQRMVELALEEARTLKPKPEIILFCAFHFDSEARKDIEETNWPGITLLEAQMNADLLTDDLKKKRSSNESFWLIGQPDVQIKEIKSGDDKGKYTVEVNGFDYYNPKTGTVDSGGKGDIAMWMLDHDYDGRSLFPSQVFFPMAGAKEGWATLAKNLRAEIDEEKIEAFGGTVSLPFTAGKNVAVKIIDARGIESLKIIRL